MGSNSIRWAFNFGNWKPTRNEWILASRCVQQEEKDRIGRFVFTKDGKASMAGRLLIRKVISDQLKIPWNEIRLERTERGKPYLVNKNYEAEKLPNFNFNVSHSGTVVVLAAEAERGCGIDVMDSTRPGNKSIPEFLRLMKKQFSDREFDTLEKVESEWAKLELFYRYWCLKESYIKAIGHGLGIPLQKVEFLPNKMELEEGRYVTDTQLNYDGELQTLWTFEETKLDENHFVATAVKQENQSEPPTPPPFKMLSFSDLMTGAIPILSEDENYWMSFASKQESPANRKNREKNTNSS